MRGSKKFFRGVPNLITFFFLLLHGEGRKDPNTTISGPSTARQRQPFKWRFAGGPMVAQHWMLD